MNVVVRKTLLVALASLHALIGAGAGERVVYFGHASLAESCHEGCACEADDEVGVAWLRFVPAAAPLGPDHDACHEEGCPHAHVRGEHAPRVAPATARAGKTPPEVAPDFLASVRRELLRSGDASVSEKTDAEPRPPDRAPPPFVRLLI